MGVERLILGTAALGEKPYGADDLTGEAATRVLQCALSNGIRHFDTAPAYGNAELRLSMLGKLTASVRLNECHITTKTHGDRTELLRSLALFKGAASLRVLWHMKDTNDIPPAEWNIDRSYYGADTTSQCWKGQVDWNLLNQTPYCGTDLDIRSVYLRGLLAKPLWCKPPTHLAEAVADCYSWADALGMPIAELALRAALQNTSAKIIIGATSVADVAFAVDIANSDPKSLGPIRMLHIGPKLADPRRW